MLLDGEIKTHVFRPRADHMPARQHIAIFIHEKDRSFSYVVVGLFPIHLQPVLNEQEAYRWCILIGVTFEGGGHIFFTLAPLKPTDESGNDQDKEKDRNPADSFRKTTRRHPFGYRDLQLL